MGRGAVGMNLPLNQLPCVFPKRVDITYLIYPMETIVVCIEYFIYSPLKGRPRRLFLLTCAENPCLTARDQPRLDTL